jgi:hypothetical protein
MFVYFVSFFALLFRSCSSSVSIRFPHFHIILIAGAVVVVVVADFSTVQSPNNMNFTKNIHFYYLSNARPQNRHKRDRTFFRYVEGKLCVRKIPENFSVKKTERFRLLLFTLSFESNSLVNKR